MSYSSYLQLEKLLNANVPVHKPIAFHEHLFITTHHAFEIWFKQLIYDLDYIIDIMKQNPIPENDLLLVQRVLKRMNEIFRVMPQQFDILETMTPLDFMEFRTSLGTASGFQSVQWRLVEHKFGLPNAKRLKYGGRTFDESLPPAEQEFLNNHIKKQETNLFEVIASWLERTPFLGGECSISQGLSYDWWKQYEMAIKKWLHFKTEQILIMILLNRNEPLFQIPFQLIQELSELDAKITQFRYRHAEMVGRMVGTKIGTGGSSGYQYLIQTAREHRVFSDLFHTSTYMIPPDMIPKLPAEVTNISSPHFTSEQIQA